MLGLKLFFWLVSCLLVQHFWNASSVPTFRPGSRSFRPVQQSQEGAEEPMMHRRFTFTQLTAFKISTAVSHFLVHRQSATLRDLPNKNVGNVVTPKTPSSRDVFKGAFRGCLASLSADLTILETLLVAEDCSRGLCSWTLSNNCCQACSPGIFGSV